MSIEGNCPNSILINNLRLMFSRSPHKGQGRAALWKFLAPTLLIQGAIRRLRTLQTLPLRPDIFFRRITFDEQETPIEIEQSVASGPAQTSGSDRPRPGPGAFGAAGVQFQQNYGQWWRQSNQSRRGRRRRWWYDQSRHHALVDRYHGDQRSLLE